MSEDLKNKLRQKMLENREENEMEDFDLEEAETETEVESEIEFEETSTENAVETEEAESSIQNEAFNEYLNERLSVEEGIDIENINLTGEFCDSSGNPIDKQKEGRIGIGYIDLVDIHIPPRGKTFSLDIGDLEESIHMWGLIEPLHVIPYRNEEGDIKYILVHGYRRYLACSALGMDTVPCIINETRPKEVVRYLEVISNNVKRYNFIEMMQIGKYIEERQKGFSHETIENILGLTSGLYLKAKYIEAAKQDFYEIYEKVVKEKMTIDAAFKKIEKELTKGPESPLDELNKNGLDTGYDQFENSAEVQKKGERHPLDPGLRKAVEVRDNYSCQSCGIGKDEPALSAIFHAHHMVPVKHKGADIEDNLIMLCPNCHSFVHSIEEGKFRPKPDMLQDNPTLANIVILANIIKRGLPDIYGGNAYKFYMERARLDWKTELEYDYE